MRLFLLAIVLLCVLSIPAGAQSKPSPADAFKGADNPTTLLVVAPKSFADALKPLIDHKNKTGMPAFLVTLESLLRNFAGKDDPEKIKRGIAYAHESLGSKYVMLVGDASLIPVRYRLVRQVPKDANLDGTYNPSELYYSNLYADHAPGKVADDPRKIGHSGRFDNWDFSGDGIHNEQHWHNDALSYNPDKVDGCPDVALGRLPAHTPQEVKDYVQKVIRYETGKLDAKAFQRYAFVADKGYGGSQHMCDDIAAMFPRGSEIDRLYLNTNAKDKVAAPWTVGNFDKIDAAADRNWWITYLGHAAPQFWAIGENGRHYDDARVAALANRKALPIVMTIGCEAGRLMSWAPSERYRDLKGTVHWFEWNAGAAAWTDKANGQKIPKRLTVPQPHPYDFPENRDRTFACSWLLRPKGGGAIAFFGESLVCENDKGKDLMKAMFQGYNAGDRILGDLWLQGSRKYWLDNRTSENVFRHPRIYLGMMNFFGDPSLRLGAKEDER